MTTDVAAAPQEIIDTPAEAPATPAPEEVTSPAGESVTEPVAEGLPPVPEFDVTQLPEYQEAVKSPPPEVVQAAAAPEMPGTPIEVARQNIERQRAQRQNSYLQASDEAMRTYLSQQLGLSAQDAHNLWHQALGPMLRDIFGDNEAFTSALFNSGIAELPDEAKAVYGKQTYRNLPERVKGAYTTGEAVERARWDARVKSGEFLTPKQVQTIASAAYARGLGKAEQDGDVVGTTSGQEIRGNATSAASEDAILLDPNAPMERVNAILDRRLGR